MPPGIGEGEAARYAALERRARRAGSRLRPGSARRRRRRARRTRPASTADALRKAQAEQVKAALEPLRRFVDASYAGAAVPKPLKAFLPAKRARWSDRRRRAKPTCAAWKTCCLAVDAALRATGNHDAEGVAKRLGDVADEVAEGCKLGLDPEKRGAASARLDAALPVLGTGADALSTLSELGADIGSVAQGEMRRIRRGLAAQSYLEAELAARHLAARLRRPKPSFSSAGGGGVESGGQRRPRRRQAARRSLASASTIRRADARACSSCPKSTRAKSARSRTRSSRPSKPSKIRSCSAKPKSAPKRCASAFEDLPDYAPGQSKSEQAAALAREHGRAMAESLSRLSLERRQAERRERQAAARAPPSRAPTAAASRPRRCSAPSKSSTSSAPGRRLAEEGAASARASAPKTRSRRSGKREQEMAERAQNISGRGSHGEAALPGEVADALDRAEGLMREAAQELANGHGERGLSAAARSAALARPSKTTTSKSGRTERRRRRTTSRAARRQARRKTTATCAQDAGVPGRAKNQKRRSSSASACSKAWRATRAGASARP